MKIPQKPLDLDTKIFPRTILKQIKKALFDKDILLLTGARQVGKTSLIYLISRYLLKEKKINPQNILFFDLEDIQTREAIENCSFDRFAKYIKEQSSKVSKSSKFVFIDEIQYLKEPSSFLKILHDHYPDIKFIVSGSSSLDLRRKFKDSLTGRKHIFIIPPLSFAEYLQFQGIGSIKKYHLNDILESKNFPVDQENSQEIARQFREFTVFGGYPEVSLIKDFEKKTAKLREIYTSYIQKDIKDLMNIENAAGFNKLVWLIAHQIGGLMNIDELTNSSALARDTVNKYLLILENTFVINLVYPYFTNKRKEITKMPKVYFADLGLRNVISKNFTALEDRADKGSIVENVVFNELNKTKQELEGIKFWRTQTKQEVDFILEGKEVIPIEVKYQSFKKPKIPKGIRSFIKTYDPKQAIVMTKDFFGIIQQEETKIYFVPNNYFML